MESTFSELHFVCMKIGTYNTDIALVKIQLWVSIPAISGFLLDPSPEIQVSARVAQGCRERVPTYVGLDTYLVGLCLFSTLVQSSALPLASQPP